MKTILLLVCSLFLASQASFGKEMITNAAAGNKEINLERIAFKNSSASKRTIVERNRIWLNLTNAGGVFKQTLIAYVTGATNGFDIQYDGTTMDSNPYVDFYSINLGINLTIQGRGLPFVITDEVPLGYKSTIAGVFQISIDHVDGLFVTHDIFLKDLSTGGIHNLKNGAYSFTTETGRFNDRFVLLYVDSTAVPPTIPEEPIASDETDPIVIIPDEPAPVVTEPEITDPIVTVPDEPAPIVTEPEVIDPIVTVPDEPAPDEPAPVVTEPEITDPILTVPDEPAPIVSDGNNHGGKEKSVFLSVKNSEIIISSLDESINEIYIYSLGHRQVFEQKNINTNEVVIPNLGVASQVLIVKTQLKNGKWSTNKIVL